GPRKNNFPFWTPNASRLPALLVGCIAAMRPSRALPGGRLDAKKNTKLFLRGPRAAATLMPYARQLGVHVLQMDVAAFIGDRCLPAAMQGMHYFRATVSHVCERAVVKTQQLAQLVALAQAEYAFACGTGLLW